MPSDRLLIVGVRHGHTEANQGGAVLRAWEDYPLDRQGELDAYFAGQKVRQWKPMIIYHDDLIRSMQTANRISALNDNLPTEVDFALRTADMGEWTAKPEEEVREQVIQWYRNPWQKAGGNGESYFDFTDRFFPAFDNKLDLSRRVHGYNPLITVMHGRNFASLQSRYQFIPPETASMPTPGGVALIKENNLGELSIEFMGTTEPVAIDK